MDQDIQKLGKEVIKLQGEKTCFLSFSGNSSSIAMFLRCFELGIFDKFILFYYYMIPNLSWVEEYFDYFKNKFKDVTLVQVPAPDLFDIMLLFKFQTPLHFNIGMEMQIAGHDFFPYYDFPSLQSELKIALGLSENILTGVGLKKVDSGLRKVYLEHYGFINKSVQEWYPVCDFTEDDVKTIISRHNVKYPHDLEFFKLYPEGFNFDFLQKVKEKRPDDYKKIKEFFPLIDLVIYRYNRYFSKKYDK